MKESIPVKDKFLLTINEASEYFNIGQKDSFALMHGNRILIIRSRCEEYIISCLKTEEGGKSL